MKQQVRCEVSSRARRREGPRSRARRPTEPLRDTQPNVRTCCFGLCEFRPLVRSFAVCAARMTAIAPATSPSTSTASTCRDVFASEERDRRRQRHVSGWPASRRYLLRIAWRSFIGSRRSFRFQQSPPSHGVHRDAALDSISASDFVSRSTRLCPENSLTRVADLRCRTDMMIRPLRC